MSVSSVDKVIEVNIGGVIFVSTVASLSSHEGVLKDILEGVVPCQRDMEGRPFIDADATSFQHVLHFLRYGSFSLPTGFDNYAALQQTCAFLLPSLHPSAIPRSPLIVSPGRQSPRSSFGMSSSPPYAKVGLQLQRVEYLMKRLD